MMLIQRENQFMQASIVRLLSNNLRKVLNLKSIPDAEKPTVIKALS